jgi:predicted Zn-dependent protease
VTGVAARVAVAVAAVAVLAWLGVMERDARFLARGIALAQPPRAPGDLERADSALRRATLLNPDTAPDTGRAFVLQASGRETSAVGLLEDVVRREPENLGAWRVLLTITRDTEAVIARRALAAVRGLDPVNAPAR